MEKGNEQGPNHTFVRYNEMGGSVILKDGKAVKQSFVAELLHSIGDS